MGVRVTVIPGRWLGRQAMLAAVEDIVAKAMRDANGTLPAIRPLRSSRGPARVARPNARGQAHDGAGDAQVPAVDPVDDRPPREAQGPAQRVADRRHEGVLVRRRPEAPDKRQTPVDAGDT
jgi:hypothetical protein